MTHPELLALRARIDAINAALLASLQERALVLDAIAEHKRKLGLPGVDAAREAEMLATVLAHPGTGFDRGALERIFRAIFAESRARVTAASS